jgi:hypothetical protein
MEKLPVFRRAIQAEKRQVTISDTRRDREQTLARA